MVVDDDYILRRANSRLCAGLNVWAILAGAAIVHQQVALIRSLHILLQIERQTCIGCRIVIACMQCA
jgi:hypothetical protein